MSKRKIPADYYSLATQRNFKWIGPKVPNALTKTNWQCSNGHIWASTYNNIQQGRGCPVCQKKVPKIEKDYFFLAKERGLNWLGPMVPTTGIKTWWKCECGHKWEACYQTIRRGHGCPKCGGIIPKSPDDYYTLAQKNGIKWFGLKVPNVHSKTLWGCENGHKWMASYNHIYKGRGCWICGGSFPKTAADYHSLAKKRGFEWVGLEVPNIHTKTKWKCQGGHKWESAYGGIQQGAGCPHCAGLAPKTPSDYHSLAKKRGFEWVGPEVPNTHIKTWWKCAEGHKWESSYHSILSHGCPTCLNLVQGVQVSKAQEQLCKMLNGELNYPIAGYKVDIAIIRSSIRIAIEYDSWFWHAHKEEEDALREAELIAEGWKVLHVKSNRLLPTQEQLDEAIARLLNGELTIDIVLDDWNIGPTRFEI